MTSMKRAFTALAAGALALPLVYAPAAYAQTAELPPLQSIEPFCENVPEDYDPFTDDDALLAEFTAAIECIAFAQVTTGVTEDLYVPARNVNRDAMASFIARLIDRSNELEAAGVDLTDLSGADATSEFTDIDGNFHEENIERLAEEDIVLGGPGELPPTMYGPAGNVTRGQMASFIVRAIEYLIAEELPVGADYFADDNGSVHEENINKLANLGIVQGSGGRYNESQFVDRDNMALFLARTLGYLAEEGYIDAAPAQEPGPAVTVETRNVAAGDPILITVSGDVDSVQVLDTSGDCVDAANYTDDFDTTSAGFQVLIPTNEDATLGTCVVDVRITDTDGNVTDTSFTVNITAAPVQEFNVVDASPETATNNFGDTHTVSIQLESDSPVANVERAGVAIGFQLIAVESADQCDTVNDLVVGAGGPYAGGVVVTDANGQATFDFNVMDPSEGDDQVVVCVRAFADNNANGEFDLGEPRDVVEKIYDEAPVGTEPPADTTPASFVATSDDNTVIVFQANEVINCSTVSVDDFSFQDGTTLTTTDATVACDGDTVTVTLSTPLAEGESLTLVALSVDDAAGNDSPAEDVTFTVVAAPTAFDADFTDADGDGNFGLVAGDLLILNLDEAVIVADGDTVTIDPDGEGEAADVVLVCGTDVLCTAEGNDLVVESLVGTAEIVILDGVSRFEDTGGIIDADGNAIDGLPELIDAAA